MSEYTSQLTILRHFPKIFSMIHMPPKPIANAGCDTTLILCKKLTYQNILPNSSISCSIYSKFSRGIICPPKLKPLVINHRAALSLFHR